MRDSGVLNKCSCSENEEIGADMRYVLQVESTGLVDKWDVMGEDKRCIKV